MRPLKRHRQHTTDQWLKFKSQANIYSKKAARIEHQDTHVSNILLFELRSPVQFSAFSFRVEQFQSTPHQIRGWSNGGTKVRFSLSARRTASAFASSHTCSHQTQEEIMLGMLLASHIGTVLDHFIISYSPHLTHDSHTGAVILQLLHHQLWRGWRHDDGGWDVQLACCIRCSQACISTCIQHSQQQHTPAQHERTEILIYIKK